VTVTLTSDRSGPRDGHQSEVKLVAYRSGGSPDHRWKGRPGSGCLKNLRSTGPDKHIQTMSRPESGHQGWVAKSRRSRYPSDSQPQAAPVRSCCTRAKSVSRSIRLVREVVGDADQVDTASYQQRLFSAWRWGPRPGRTVGQAPRTPIGASRANPRSETVRSDWQALKGFRALQRAAHDILGR